MCSLSNVKQRLDELGEIGRKAMVPYYCNFNGNESLFTSRAMSLFHFDYDLTLHAKIRRNTRE